MAPALGGPTDSYPETARRSTVGADGRLWDETVANRGHPSYNAKYIQHNGPSPLARYIRNGAGSVMLATRILVSLAGGMLVFAATAAAQQQPATPLVFDNVTVVDVAKGKLVPDQRVVIEGNRIKAMGAVKSVPAPAGAQTVEARGKFLIPGLW